MFKTVFIQSKIDVGGKSRKGIFATRGHSTRLYFYGPTQQKLRETIVLFYVVYLLMDYFN